MPVSLQQDVVGIFHYRLSNSNGELLEDSFGSQPLLYIHGRDNLIKGLESHLHGKKIGDVFTAEILPKEGYGEYDEDAFFQVHRNEFPQGQFEKLDEGGQMLLEDSNGESVMVWIHKKEGAWCHLTTNHPLSGQTLVFEVEVIGMREALAIELEQNHPNGIDETTIHRQND